MGGRPQGRRIPYSFDCISALCTTTPTRTVSPNREPRTANVASLHHASHGIPCDAHVTVTVTVTPATARLCTAVSLPKNAPDKQHWHERAYRDARCHVADAGSWKRRRLSNPCPRRSCSTRLRSPAAQPPTPRAGSDQAANLFRLIPLPPPSSLLATCGSSLFAPDAALHLGTDQTLTRTLQPLSTALSHSTTCIHHCLVRLIARIAFDVSFDTNTI
jgi:hypothetical protein